MKRFSLSETDVYIFSDYFKSTSYVEDVVDYFGYCFKVIEEMNLLRSEIELTTLSFLKGNLRKNVHRVRFTNEIARREFLIAPILSEVAEYANAQIKVEYPIKVNSQLGGSLDYFLEKKHNLLVIEAKKADLERGFL